MITSETTPDQIPYAALKNICKNNGQLHVNGSCTCQSGYTGDNCEVHICDRYCLTGECVINSTGQPTCKCPDSNYGDQCEKELCSSPCQNNGRCVMDKDGNPRCECKTGYVGEACQFNTAANWLNELCPVFCQYASKMSKSQQSVCR